MINEESSVREKLLPKNNDKMDKARIENEKEISPQEPEGDLRLHDAVYDPDNIDEIIDLITNEPKLVFERDAEGRTPLITTALAGDEAAAEIAKILVGATEDEDDSSLISIERPEILNLQDSQNATALHVAAKGRQPELVKALLRWGSNLGIQDGKGNTALHLVAEGNTEKAIEVMKILLSHDTKKVLINTFNNEEMTPLDIAISKRAAKMVKFLLQSEFKCNLSIKTELGRTSIHKACSETGESASSCEIVQEILKSCSKAQLNMGDKSGKTCLHLSAIKRLPKITRILVEDERMDVTVLDDKKRTALHYSTEDGCYTKAYKCVEALISREFENYENRVNYLFKMEDMEKCTPFTYACLNCPSETMKKYVSLCPKPQYWLSNNYMSLIYKNSPLAIKALMNNVFSEVDTEEGEDAIQTDFGIITGYTDPVDVLPQQETKYLKESLWWDYETQRKILLHPLSQLFILKKWQKLKWIIFSWIVWQLIWVVAYSGVALSFYSKTVESSVLPILGAIVMLVYVTASLLNECFEMFTIGSAYILSLTNILQLTQNVLGFLVIYFVFMGFDEPPDWMKYTTALGVLLAYIMSMRDIGKLHSEIGLIVEVLKQVLFQIVQVLVCCSPLWIGFTIAFILIFDNEESLHSRFPGPIVKVLVMMTGEFEYNDTFKNDDEGAAKENNASIRVFRLLFFLAFLISIPIGFFNLVTGFALDKVMELRERAKVARIAKQLEQIYFIESILLSFRPLRKVLSHGVVVSFLRRLNVTSKWFTTRKDVGPELKFDTLVREKIRKSHVRKGGFRRKMPCGGEYSFCPTELPSDVKEEIYSLASPIAPKY